MAASGDGSLPLSIQKDGEILDRLTLRYLDVDERFKESCHGCCLKAFWRDLRGIVGHWHVPYATPSACYFIVRRATPVSGSVMIWCFVIKSAIMAWRKQPMTQEEETDFAAKMFRYSPPIERESYSLNDGGIFELGLFPSYADFSCDRSDLLIAELYSSPNGEIRYGTVRKFLDETLGMNRFQEIKRTWDSRKTPESPLSFW
jgi:hypothetical protein